MSTDLTIRQSAEVSFAEQAEFARMVTSGNRGASLLPDAYKENPANVLIAVGLGASMGLSPAESLYRISVIKGKPSAGAELIAANVRRAGHKLRVQGGEDSCTATIIRADDPDFPFEVTRDMAWAKKMGLDKNDNYRKQAGTMLQWRAITAVARLACPEALYGVAYTPDEISDAPSTDPAPQASAADFAPTQQAPTAPSPATEPPPPPPEGQTIAEAITEPQPITAKTRAHMFALLGELGIEDADQQRQGMSKVLGREVESRASLTEDEGRAIVMELQARVPAGEQQ